MIDLRYAVMVLCQALILCCGWSNQGQAHPFHTTTAELEFNAASGRYEVALKIPASDFEHMVHYGAKLQASRGASTELVVQLPAKNLEKLDLKQAEKYAALYMAEHFTLAVAGKPCGFEWIGSENDQSATWIYFELILPRESKISGETILTNKVLCDLNKGQINTVVLLSKATRVSLKTYEQSSTVTLPACE